MLEDGKAMPSGWYEVLTERRQVKPTYLLSKARERLAALEAAEGQADGN